mmetsp:Transcript_124969/g.358789  ORF Transcript_124969/g.358789 Transcript_124969/m.358789 type:complete len:215 (+) Transcript_124969:279-923(+)
MAWPTQHHTGLYGGDGLPRWALEHFVASQQAQSEQQLRANAPGAQRGEQRRGRPIIASIASAPTRLPSAAPRLAACPVCCRAKSTGDQRLCRATGIGLAALANRRQSSLGMLPVPAPRQRPHPGNRQARKGTPLTQPYREAHGRWQGRRRRPKGRSRRATRGMTSVLFRDLPSGTPQRLRGIFDSVVHALQLCDRRSRCFAFSTCPRLWRGCLL